MVKGAFAARHIKLMVHLVLTFQSLHLMMLMLLRPNGDQILYHELFLHVSDRMPYILGYLSRR